MTSVAYETTPAGRYQARAERTRLLAALLGSKAKQRRLELGLSRAKVAAAIGGTTGANIIGWENRIPFDAFPVEASWERVLGVPKGWLRDQFMDPIPGGFQPDVSLEMPGAMNAGLRGVGNAVAAELVRLCGIGAEGNRLTAEAIACRYGVHGSTMATSEAVCQRFNITRRQLESLEQAFKQRVSELSPQTPALVELREKIDQLVPIGLSDLNAALKPLLGPTLAVEDVDRFCAEVLDLALLNLEDGMLGPVALASDAEYGQIRDLYLIARSIAAWTGAVNISAVAGVYGRLYPEKNASVRTMARWCSALPGFEWIDQPSGWFWLGLDVPSRVHMITRQILSVATDRVEVCEIRAILGREVSPNKELCRHEMPIDILEELLARFPEVVRVHRHNSVRARQAIDPADVLEPGDQALQRVLSGSGGVATLETIIAKMGVELGATKEQAKQMLRTSRVVVAVADGVYRLCGSSLDPKVYLAACVRRERQLEAV